MEHDVEVMDARANGTTGHIEVDVRAVKEVENTVQYGPKRTYGIDATALKTHYNGDIHEWLGWVKHQHQAHHGLHGMAMDVLNTLKGKRL